VTSQLQQQQQAQPVRAAIPAAEANGEHPLEVGDRVLCNGKYGALAFIGPTQFAKGSWAGIILDTPEGKNNGSVNGVQYFECEPNRGLFAKQEKIQFVSKGDSPSSQSKPPRPASNERQFKVGDSVLVDGQKEGVIGFIGTTQFAKGIWAGIILNSPDGKNDGWVSGIQYFECERDHGLFTRLHKLKLLSKGEDSPPHQPPPSRTPQDEGQRASLTPVDLKALHNKLNVGDHVLVSGVKEGVLRFLGPTEFAKGIWVGVELPEPMGKNDGAISGKR
jgi:dynactin complex subunit